MVSLSLSVIYIHISIYVYILSFLVGHCGLGNRIWHSSYKSKCLCSLQLEASYAFYMELAMKLEYFLEMISLGALAYKLALVDILLSCSKYQTFVHGLHMFGFGFLVLYNILIFPIHNDNTAFCAAFP